MLLVALVLLCACVGQSAATTSSEVGSTASSDAVATTVVGTTTTQALVLGCPDEGEFVEGGTIADIENPSSDTGIIGLIGWQEDEACETFEIVFETSEGAPATTPPSITAEYVEGIGVIRIRLDAADTVVTDQLVETALVERLYAVRSLEGGMFLDLHLAAAAQARILTSRSPATMTLQLQPGILDFPGDAATSRRVVLTSPTDDATVGTAVTVEGYARTFESNVLMVATRGDDVITEQTTTSADSVTTWGQFRMESELSPGPLSLFVGEESVETGRFEGVSIDLVATQ